MRRHKPTIRMVDATTVHHLLDWPGLIQYLRQAHLGPEPEYARTFLSEPRESGHPNMLLVVPAWQHGSALGVKLVTSFPGNVSEYKIPTVDALYILFDPKTGTPTVIIDGEALIFRKTAADTALAASILAPPDAEHLLMVGAGALASYVIDALLTVRPSISEIRIWNRTSSRADDLARTLRQRDINASATDALEGSQTWADIIVAATMASEPLIKGAHVRPGTHVNLIGSFTPEMRESDNDLLRKSQIYVDGYNCLERTGEFVGPMAAGIITRDSIRADLFALCRGNVIPPDASNCISLFKNGGAGQLDLFTASYLMKRLSKK